MTDMDDELLEVARELGELHLWAERNGHRGDWKYVEFQKPANDRHIARLEALLAKELA